MPMTTDFHPLPVRRGRWLALLGLTTVLLVGCGRADGSSVASLDDSDGGGAGASAQPSAPADADDALAEFRRCMQDQGVPFDSAAGVGRTPEDEQPDPNLQAAAKECEHLLEGSGVSFAAGGGGEQLGADQLEGLVSFARCMRDNGIAIPDPDPSSGGLLLGQGGVDVDPDSPEYVEAHETCKDELPGVDSEQADR